MRTEERKRGREKRWVGNRKGEFAVKGRRKWSKGVLEAVRMRAERWREEGGGSTCVIGRN